MLKIGGGGGLEIAYKTGRASLATQLWIPLRRWLLIKIRKIWDFLTWLYEA